MTHLLSVCALVARRAKGTLGCLGDSIASRSGGDCASLLSPSEISVSGVLGPVLGSPDKRDLKLLEWVQWEARKRW